MTMHLCRLKTCLFWIVVGLGSSVVGATRASAVNLETSKYVSSAQITPKNGFFERTDTNRRALVNRQTCLDFFEHDIEIGFYFSLNTSDNPDAYVFAAQTDQTPDDFDCDAQDMGNCRRVEPINEFDDATQGGAVSADYGKLIDFSNLVDEAVDGLESSNNIQLLGNKTACTEKPVDQEYFYRLIFDTESTDIEEMSDLVIEVDTQPPGPPDQVSDVTVTESSVFVSWTEEQSGLGDVILEVDDEEANRRNPSPFVAFYASHDITGQSVDELLAASDVYMRTIDRDDANNQGPTFSGKAPLDEIDLSDESSRVWVGVSTRDDIGNLSDPVFPEGAEDGFQVVPVIDFWEHYNEAGGRETGGCAAATPGHPSGGGAGWLLLLGLGWFGARRRRRLWRCAPVIAAGLTFAATATVASTAHAESPTWGIAELRVGGYFPSIDDEAGLSGNPFKDVFGASNRVLVEYEQGVHFFEGFGDLGASLAAGYTHFSGDVLFEPGSAADAETVDETTGFTVVPFRLSAYYRLDSFEEHWNIPLVPVVEGGLDYVLWQAEAPNGNAAEADGHAGEGGTFGWHVAAALHLQLDWIDQQSAASFDLNWGINNTYAFAEYSLREVDDFGSSDSFDLSDRMWMFGLAFEY